MLLTGLRLLLLLSIVTWSWLGTSRARADANSCTFAMSEVAFGSVDVLPGTAISSSGTLSVRCSGLGTVVGSTLSACVSFPTPRRIQGSSSSLNYDFYGPNGTNTWSSTTPILFPLSLLLSGGTASQTIPAAILAGQATASPGFYTSTVTASISFGLLGCSTGVVYSTTVTFQVDATVLSTCNVGAQTIDFGSTGPLMTATDGLGQVSAQCTANTAFSIGMDGGLSVATDPTARQMRPTTGSGSITYGLYRNASRTLPWGNTAGSNVVSGTGTAASQAFPVYARIPAQGTPAAGSYSDRIVVTVTY